MHQYWHSRRDSRENVLKENFVGLASTSLDPSFLRPLFSSFSFLPSFFLSLFLPLHPSLLLPFPFFLPLSFFLPFLLSFLPHFHLLFPHCLSLLSSSLSPSVHSQNSGSRIQVPSTRDLFGLWKVNKKSGQERVQGWHKRSGTSTPRGMKPRQPTECPESCTSPSAGGSSTLDKSDRVLQPGGSKEPSEI